MNELIIDNLAVYRGRQVVLRDVSLKINGPGLYGVIGPNGGGKSTLLSVICGLLPHNKGRIEVFGTTPKKAAPRLALVPQAAGFDRSFPITLRELVETARLGPGLFKQTGQDSLDQVESALNKTGTLALAERPLSALSGGELQRSLIARALATNPEFLLLDEPTASVDSDHADRLFELLCDLGQKIPVLVISHGLGHVAAHCNRVFCVDKTLWEAKDTATTVALAAEIFSKQIQCDKHKVKL